MLPVVEGRVDPLVKYFANTPNELPRFKSPVRVYVPPVEVREYVPRATRYRVKGGAQCKSPCTGIW
jgi:hypothetical protein